MALPDLQTVLTARTDGFEASLNRASKAAEKASADISGSTQKISLAFEALKGAAAGVAGALTVGAFTSLIKGAIDSADHLNDLSQRTGVAVESLAGLELSAKQSGVSLDQVASGLGKLDKSLAAATAGNKSALEAFNALGISVKDAKGHAIDADTAFKRIADSFAGANDGPEKAAIALRLFGKAGADLIPLLNGGGDAIQKNKDFVEKYGGVTAEVAKQADQFNDTLAKLGIISGSFGRTLAADLLPSLQTLADKFLELRQNGDGFKTIAADLAEAFKFIASRGIELTFVYVQLTLATKALFQELNAVAHLDFSKAGAIDDAFFERFKKGAAVVRELTHAIEDSKAKPGTKFQGDDYYGKSIKKTLDDTGGGSGRGHEVDLAKKLLDQQIKDLDVFIGREKDLLSSRDQYLQLYYQRDEVSITDYFSFRATALQENLQSTRTAYAAEIADLEKYIATKSKSNDPKNEGKVIDAQTKLIEVRAKLAKAEESASDQTIKDWFANKKAVQAYQDGLDELEAQIKAFQGDTAGAFEINFDKQTRSKKDQYKAVLNSDDSTQADRNKATQGIIDLGQIKQQGIARAKLADEDKKRGDVLGELFNAQERINIAVSSGAKTELEGLQATSKANLDILPLLEARVAAYQKIADETGDKTAAIQADALRVQLERLATQTDLVADKFRDAGKSVATNFLDKLESGTASAKDLFKSLAADANKELLKIANKEIIDTIFKKDGALGDFGKTIASFFGGSTSGSGAGAIAGAAGGLGSAANDTAFAALTATVTASDASLAALGVTTPVVDTALVALGTAATEATAALALMATSLGSSGGGDALGSFIGTLASAKGNVFSGGSVLPFARGGVVSSPTIFPMANGGTGLMGEAGPEAIMPLKRGRGGALGVAVDGAQGATHVTNITNHVTVAAPANGDRRSASQHGAEIARQLQMASARNR